MKKAAVVLDSRFFFMGGLESRGLCQRIDVRPSRNHEDKNEKRDIYPGDLIAKYLR